MVRGTVLYQLPSDSSCIKARAILRWKNVPFGTIDVFPLLSRRRLKKISGQSRVPVLIHAGTVVSDSTEIAFFLEKSIPDPPLLPAVDEQRLESLLWEDWADEALSSTVGLRILEEARRDPEIALRGLPPSGKPFLDRLIAGVAPLALRVLAALRGLDERGVEEAGKRLTAYAELIYRRLQATGFLVGSTRTLADIAVASRIRALDLASVPLPGARAESLRLWSKGILGDLGEA